jgi:hypothetical protein
MTRSRRYTLRTLGLVLIAAGLWIIDPFAADAPVDVPQLPTARIAAADDSPRPAENDGLEGEASGEQADDRGQFAVPDRAAPESLAGRAALERSVTLLRDGLTRIAATNDYRATFHRRERIAGLVENPHVCRLCVRHEPFSVQLEWLTVDRGRRAAFVEGRHDDRLLVRLGGWKARLPVLKLDPDGSTALKSSRHPVTEAGLRELTRRLIAHRKDDLETGREVTCQLHGNRLWNERPCFEFVVEYPDRAATPAHAYRKSIQYIDREWLLPVHVLNYAWPHADESIAAGSLDEATFVESYGYTDLAFDVGLEDADFDVSR